MLAEAEARENSQSENDHPVKRRKVEEKSNATRANSGPEPIPAINKDEVREVQIQTVYDSAATDESDMEWEDVEIQQTPGVMASRFSGNEEPLQITLGQQQSVKGRTIIPKRRLVSAAEKKLRLSIHKVHLLCLLGHVQLRNLYCNDEGLQAYLKRTLPRHIVALLNPSKEKPQFTRSTTFIDGLNQASDIFIKRFKVTNPGMRRPHWANDPNSLKQKAETIISNAEVILSKDDFCSQARTLQGSRDFGAQLFCALLRSVGVDARLVCSLQPLPFSGGVKDAVAVPESRQIIISSDDHESSPDEQVRSGSTPARSRIRRFGQPQITPPQPKQTTARPGTNPCFRESSYPVFWVEAFNEAVQKWIPVDPLATKTLAKPLKLEPPASDPYNIMSYVVAFEEDASARDVTRRYVKAFNAKTRKLRVESTKDGEMWWARTLKFYEKPFMEDRDEIEISELTAKSAAEPMPRNVQDFKDHPVYALERHLRWNEAIFPKRAIGQVGVNKSGSKKQSLEPVYRRANVHPLRSANGWYRLGRDIKVGEQPLKHVRANRIKAPNVNEDGEADDETARTPLYAYFQTEPYKPPPVVDGRIPKNMYGNLDVYVPSMVPQGAVHIKHGDAVQAARILGIDYAEAVTGFNFKGRHGTAIFEGVVIAEEFRDALEEVIHGLEDERLQSELEYKSAEALRLWKLFLLKLRIAERVKGYAVEGETGSIMGEEESEENAGGFFPEPEQGTASVVFGQGAPGGDISPQPIPEDETMGGGFMADESMENTAEPKPLGLDIRNVAGTSHSPGRPSQSRSRYTLVVTPSDKRKTCDSNQNDRASAHLHGDVPIQKGMGTPEKETGQPQETAPTGVTGVSENPILIESSTGEHSKQGSVEVLSRPPSPNADGRSSDGSVEAVSLLSEDPEDEDAVPEWLMSD